MRSQNRQRTSARSAAPGSQSCDTPAGSHQPALFPQLRIVDPDPLIAAGLVHDALGDAQHIILMPQEDARRFLLNEALQLRVGGETLLRVKRRARFVDQLIQSWNTCVPLANPAPGFSMV